jgi:hypothetical protein
LAVARELAENLYEEDTGRISGVNKCPMDVFFDFLAAFGISPEEASQLAPPHGRHVPRGRAIPKEDFYVELATYGLSVETPNAEFSEGIFTAFRDNYGFAESELTWFVVISSDDHAGTCRCGPIGIGSEVDSDPGLHRPERRAKPSRSCVREVTSSFVNTFFR